MSAPTIVRVYPANGDTGIPVGETLAVYFNKGVDEQTVKDSIVLFGSDTDTTSGPDQAIWIDEKTKEKKYFLSSPGFKGYVPLIFEIVYWDTTDTVTYAEVSNPSVIDGEAAEATADYGHKVKITVDPKFASTLAPDTQYTLYINGDPDGTNTGISSRTVFDVEANVANTGSGEVYVYGTFTGTDDTFNIEITKAGNIGVAEYKYWLDSDGPSAATLKRVTNRRFRSLSDGLQIRFNGSDFAVGDKWTFNLESITRLATSTSVTFTTNDGSYTTAPESTSTPASSTPASSVLPSDYDPFGIRKMIPEDASYNVDFNNRVIVIEFTQDVDPDTITDESIVLWKYPVEGYHSTTWAPVELQKTITVSGSTVTIRF